MNTLLRNVRPNIVQSIRAFNVAQLQQAAQDMSQHFLYVNLAKTLTKQDILESIASSFKLPIHFGKNFDALYDSITDPVHKSGVQTGFIVVLEHIPTNSKFDKETREQLLDTFRDAADYWADRKIPFRCFYSFSVARASQSGQSVMQAVAEDDVAALEAEEKLPTDKLVDVTPLALRMSSPFNPQYWSTVA